MVATMKLKHILQHMGTKTAGFLPHYVRLKRRTCNESTANSERLIPVVATATPEPRVIEFPSGSFGGT